MSVEDRPSRAGTGPRQKPSPEAVELARAARRLGLQTAAAVLGSVLLMAAVVLAVVVRGQARDAEAKVEQVAHTIDDTRDVPPGLWVTVMSTADGTTTSSAGLPDGLPDLGAFRAVQEHGRDGDVRDRHDRARDAHDGEVLPRVPAPAHAMARIRRKMVATPG